MSTQDLITTYEAAQILGLRFTATVRKWIADGKIENANKVGRDWQISRIEVEALAAKRKEGKRKK